MRAVIMAGGKGTRLSSLTKDIIPKPLISIAGKSILNWQIEALKRNGITKICIVTGFLGEKIKEALSSFDGFTFFNEETPLGTAGALSFLKSFIDGEPFVLAYGDSIFDIDIPRMADFHYKRDALITLFAHPNSHPFDSDILRIDDMGRVTGFFAKNTHNEADEWRGNMVNAGFYIISPEICDLIPRGDPCDLEKDFIRPRIENGDSIFGYVSSEYIKDAGTPQRLTQVERDIKTGVVTARNLKLPQRCVFLDRDGTINKYKGLICNPDDFELLPGAADAIRMINESGYLAVVVTNQPVVARGLCGIDTLDLIHRKMAALLGDEGAYTDAVYYCPHHPDKGFPEEVAEYKIKCECRKPGIGMIKQAQARFNIDLWLSWIVGDYRTDIQAGINAGLNTALVMTGTGAGDMTGITPDITCKDLSGAVRHIMGRAYTHPSI